VEFPQSLPARFYLLAYDPAKQRPVTGERIQYSLRAAALTDLWLTGHLTDERGRPTPAPRGTAAPVADPVLAAILGQIEESRPRKWEHWISRSDRGIRAAVRDQLVAGRWIRAEQHRRLGLIRTDRITIRDPLLRKGLTAAVTETLRPGRLVAQLDPRDAALTALAATGKARTALPRGTARQHRARIGQLTEVAGPALPALRKAINSANAAAASAG